MLKTGTYTSLYQIYNDEFIFTINEDGFLHVISCLRENSLDIYMECVRCIVYMQSEYFVVMFHCVKHDSHRNSFRASNVQIKCSV